MDTTLELICEYANQFEKQIDLLSLYQEEYYTESVGKTMERILVLLDQFFVNIKNVLSIHRKQKEVDSYLKRLQRLKRTLTKKEYNRMMIIQLPALGDARTVDDELQIIRNLWAIYKIKPGSELDKARTANLKNLVPPRGKEFERTRGHVYYTNLSWLENMVTRCDEDLEKLEKQTKECLFDFDKMQEQTKEKTLKDMSLVKFLKASISVIKQHIICMFYNMESFIDGMKGSAHQMIDKETIRRIHAYDKLKDKERIEKYEKNAKHIKTITVGEQNFELYQIDISNVSCYNRNGTHIYVDKSFFENSVAHQKAIIWHEIGHTMSGHFGLVKGNYPDEEKRIRQMKKDIIRFKRFQKSAMFVHSEDELVYLLCEWEADRYAAKQVGKSNVRKSLMDDAEVGFFASIIKDPENITDKEAMILAYNKERMKLRTQLM